MSTEIHATVRQFLDLLFQPGDVLEIRAPKCRARRSSNYAATASGYFSDLDKAAEAVVALDQTGLAPSVYVTLNPVLPELLARASNRIKHGVRVTTTDGEVVRRTTLLIDLDSVRPTGISATADELAAAYAVAIQIRDYLTAAGWPLPIIVMSGNGYHLLYRIDLPADDDGLVKRVLAALSDRFSTPAVQVDRGVHNAARITKVVGTVSRKGDPLEDRPHRRSGFIEVPEVFVVVPIELLEAIGQPVVERPQSVPIIGSDRFDCTPNGVRTWLESRGVSIKGERHNGTKTLLLLDHCPINPEIISTGTSDIAVSVGDDGKLSYCNKHNRGQGYTWQDLRRALDPEYAARPQKDPGVDLSQFMVQNTAKNSKDEPSEQIKNNSLLPARAIIPTYVTAKTIIDAHPELREPIIYGLLRRSEVMNLIASPKTKKSFMVMQMLVCAAIGRPWLAFQMRQSNCLLLDNELHPQTLAKRLGRILYEMDLSSDDIGRRLAIETLRGKPCDIYGLRPYFEAIPAGTFDLIAIDAWYRLQPRDSDENSNSAICQAYSQLDLYAQMTEAAIVIVHHASKGSQYDKSVTDVGAGAGAQSRAADSHVILREHDEPDAVVLQAAVRSWPPVPAIALRWSYPVWSTAPDLDPLNLKQPRQKRKVTIEETTPVIPWTVERLVMEILGDKPTPATWVIAKAKQAGLSERATKRLLDEAEAIGLVSRKPAADKRMIYQVNTPC